MTGNRLDIYLAQHENYSRENAKRVIADGYVKINGVIVTKPSTAVTTDDTVIVEAPTMPFVSRGGEKLQHALLTFRLDLSGLTCLDAGASTGGFTDCMLQNGAARVYAVDVGHSQLAPKLVTDNRVVSIEHTNIKDITPAMFEHALDFATADLSFISITKAAPFIIDVVRPQASLVFLIKPQFEAGELPNGRRYLNKQGVITDARFRKSVVDNTIERLVLLGLKLNGITESPIKGQNGNTEYLAHFTRADTSRLNSER